MKNMKTEIVAFRAKALQWWRCLDEEHCEKLAAKWFPCWPYRAVTTSSSMIERIYRWEMRGFI